MPDLRSLGLTFLSGCLLLGSGALLAGTGNRTDAPATLPGTQAFVLASPETGRDYLIQVAVPRRQPPAEGYPVLYVLDGNARFALTLAARDTLFSGSPADLPSPWLIVAIGYPGTDRFDTDARAEDYTPPAQRLDAGSRSGRSARRLPPVAPPPRFVRLDALLTSSRARRVISVRPYDSIMCATEASRSLI